MGWNSLSLKVAKFKAIEGAGGMEGFSRQAKAIEKRYQDLSDSELRLAGIEAVATALNKNSNRN